TRPAGGRRARRHALRQEHVPEPGHDGRLCRTGAAATAGRRLRLKSGGGRGGQSRPRHGLRRYRLRARGRPRRFPRSGPAHRRLRAAGRRWRAAVRAGGHARTRRRCGVAGGARGGGGLRRLRWQPQESRSVEENIGRTRRRAGAPGETQSARRARPWRHHARRDRDLDTGGNRRRPPRRESARRRARAITYGSRMEIKGTQRIEASRTAVWTALNDPEVLKQSIPGCESIEKVSDTEMNAKVTLRIGPVKASFSGKVILSDLDPP